MPKNGTATRKRPGQPTKYTEAIADEICERLSQGETLSEICRDAHMPTEAKVRLWAINDRADLSGLGAGFRARYAQARELGYERMAEEIIEISDDNYTGNDGLVDNGAVQQARLRSDNRKWLLAKMMPKRFGDRVTTEITGDASAPLLTRIELVAVPAKVIEHDPVRERIASQVHLPQKDGLRAPARSGLDVTDTADD
jgi:hypothetical protein